MVINGCCIIYCIWVLITESFAVNSRMVKFHLLEFNVPVNFFSHVGTKVHALNQFSPRDFCRGVGYTRQQ